LTTTLTFPQPLRLARGSHPEGSGYGCGANVIAWEQGRTITDYPDCVARPLAHLIHTVNDTVCQHMTTVSGSLDVPGWEDLASVDLLCSPCSLRVLDLAHRTVGTSSITGRQLGRWVAELLAGEHGVVGFLTRPEDIAYLHMAAGVVERRANGVVPSVFSPRPLAPTEAWATTSRRALNLAESLLDRLCTWGSYCPGSTAQPWTSVFHDVAVEYARVEEIRPGEEGYPATLLAAAHRAVDIWEDVTGTSPPPVVAEDVRDAVGRMAVAV